MQRAHAHLDYLGVAAWTMPGLSRHSPFPALLGLSRQRFLGGWGYDRAPIAVRSLVLHISRTDKELTC